MLQESLGDGEDARADATPHGKPLLEGFGREQGAVVHRVVGKNPLQFVRRGGVEDEGVHLVVKA